MFKRKGMGSKAFENLKKNAILVQQGIPKQPLPGRDKAHSRLLTYCYYHQHRQQST